MLGFEFLVPYLPFFILFIPLYCSIFLIVLKNIAILKFENVIILSPIYDINIKNKKQWMVNNGP